MLSEAKLNKQREMLAANLERQAAMGKYHIRPQGLRSREELAAIRKTAALDSFLNDEKTNREWGYHWRDFVRTGIEPRSHMSNCSAALADWDKGKARRVAPYPPCH